MAKKKTTTTTALLPLLLLLLFATLLTRGHALNISTLEEFKEFASNVNSGTNYKGETVSLTNDLDFTGYSSSFVPIGKANDANTFRGTFDGNGHKISNLNVSSGKFRFMGVFGYSTGATIKNLVVDTSCSFESSFSNSSYSNNAVAGIFGLCKSSDGECVVEGCVNMAHIKYSGEGSSSTVHLGGVVGKFEPSIHSTSITNCANYGDISSTSTSISNIRMGGITGEVWTDRSLSSSNTVKNCVNYGALSQSGSVNNSLYIGGIAGSDSPNIAYEGCVSLGEISYNESLTCYISLGAISGKSNSSTFTSCFWSDEIAFNATGSRSSNTTMQGSVEAFDMSTLGVNTTVVSILNSGSNDMWCVLNFDSNGGSAVGPVLVILSGAVKSAVVESLPTPTKEGHSFGEWYSDEDFTNPFNASELVSVSTTLYARWNVNSYTIAFIVDGEERNKTTQEFNSNITYPENPTKEGYTFDGWNETLLTVPARNVTIEALWVINNYTITFIVDGTLNETRTLPYQSAIPFPENLTKEGFTFDGWYMDSAFKNKTNNSMNVTGNASFYGRFISAVVKIEFSTKDLTRDEVINEIEEITKCTNCFAIIEVKEDGNESGTIIIRFNDLTEAMNFVDVIKK